MMEQHLFPEEKKKNKKGDKHRNASTKRNQQIMMEQNFFLRKERREKRGDKHRNPSRNQEEPANHDGTEPLS